MNFDKYLKNFGLSLLFIISSINATENSEAVGIAIMLDDGTISFYPFHKENILADGQAMIKPENEIYQKLLDHLGGMKVGEEKLVPPWPKEE